MRGEERERDVEEEEDDDDNKAFSPYGLQGRITIFLCRSVSVLWQSKVFHSFPLSIYFNGDQDIVISFPSIDIVILLTRLEERK